MKKTITAVVIGILLLPLVASANIFTMRYGYFVPRMSGGPDSLWNIEFENMSFKKSEFQGGVLGLAYEYFLNRNISLVLSIDFYNRNKAGFYKDWSLFRIDGSYFAFPYEYYPTGDMIIHNFEVSQTPLSVSLKVTPLGRRVRFVPYFGGGISLCLWTVRLRGDIIDFSDPYIYTDPYLGDVYVYPVDFAVLDEANRLAMAYNAFAGVMLPIGNRMTLDLGARYNFLKVDFRDTFVGFEKFDLSGYSLIIGLNFWF